jgi:putative oxidoreductase
LLVGRTLFGAFFIMSGLNHFQNLAMMSGYAQSKNVPSPRLAVIGIGAPAGATSHGRWLHMGWR